MIVDENTKIYVGDIQIKKIYQGNTDISPLPYTELEYIEDTGTQYINTGFQANGGMTAKYRAAWTDKGGYIVGSHNYNNPYGRNGGNYSDASSMWELGYGDYYPRISHQFAKEQIYDVEFSTIIGQAYLKVDGETLHTDTRTTTISTLDVMVFTNSYSVRNNPSAPGTKARLYWLKIYDSNGNLVRDFIPVLDKSNVPCLYDKVSKTYFYNQGTGQFLYR